MTADQDQETKQPLDYEQRFDDEVAKIHRRDLVRNLVKIICTVCLVLAFIAWWPE